MGGRDGGSPEIVEKHRKYSKNVSTHMKIMGGGDGACTLLMRRLAILLISPSAISDFRHLCTLYAVVGCRAAV
jgi:hypothetical protein